MKFSELVSLLSDTGNRPYVLQCGKRGRKVVVAPSLVGRVMGSTIAGDRGRVLGWIKPSAIEKGMVDPVFNDFGGAERFWFAPEGGQFGLCMGRHIASPEHYHAPDGFNTQPFKVLTHDQSSVVMRSRMAFKNAGGTAFAVEVTRSVRVLDACPYTLGFGKEIDFVGFQSDNITQNVSSKGIERATGAPAMFCISQFSSNNRLLIIIPVQPGPRGKLGPPIRWEYFEDYPVLKGGLSRKYWRAMPDAVLFNVADEHGKIGVGRPRAVPRLASLDLDSHELIIVDCDFHPELEYVAGYWRRLENPYDGDVLSAAFGSLKQNGVKLYELETLSPALFLQPGRFFSHRNRVFHLFGPRDVIDAICQKFLRVSRPMLEEFDAGSA